MNEHIMLRLLLRVAGVVVIAFALPGVFDVVGWFIDILIETGQTGSFNYNSASTVVYLLAPFAQLGFGIYLLVGGRALRERFACQIAERCSVCGCPWEGPEVMTCPACGARREKIIAEGLSTHPGSGAGSESTASD